MTAPSTIASRNRTSGRSTWRRRTNARRARRLGRESRQANGNNVFRWYRGGWGRYSQADPYGVRRDELNLFGYVNARPTSLADPFGLYAIQSNCDCPGTSLGNIPQGVVAACNYPKKPACADLLKKFTFGGEPLDQCLKKRCSDGTKIFCHPEVKGPCGGYSGGIYLYGGGPGCPRQKGFGVGPTIFHESIHSCGLAQEPYKEQPYSNVFNKIMDVCTGFKEK